MGLLKTVRNIFQKINDCSYSLGQKYGEIKKIRNPKRKKLIASVELSNEEKKKIDEFYKKYYGKKIKYDWHRLYQSFTSNFDEKYFPDLLFSTKLEPLMNDNDYRRVLGDKRLVDIFIRNIDNLKTPKILGYYYKNIYCDSKNNIISNCRPN